MSPFSLPLRAKKSRTSSNKASSGGANTNSGDFCGSEGDGILGEVEESRPLGASGGNIFMSGGDGEGLLDEDKANGASSNVASCTVSEAGSCDSIFVCGETRTCAWLLRGCAGVRPPHPARGMDVPLFFPFPFTLLLLSRVADMRGTKTSVGRLVD